MRAEPLPEKALRVGDSLIIADLHIGFEEAMLREGSYVPKLLGEVTSSLQRLLERERPKRLVIDGDLKHSFIPFRREMKELRGFLGEIEGYTDELILIRGNHDVGISWIKGMGVEVLDSLEVGGWKLVHGHRLEEGERFIIGHEHPAVRLRDEVGASIKVPAFLKGENLIVLPAFSPWAYGNDVTREIVSPFLRMFDTSRMRVLVPVEGELLDFGRLGELLNALRRLSAV